MKSPTKAMAFGNIIFGGLIGTGIDVATGATHDYPTMITVLIDEKISIYTPPVDKAKEAESQAAAGTVSTVAANAPATEVKP